MGKLRSKYHILEVFGYAGYSQTMVSHIARINHNLRDLLIDNYSIIHSILKYRPAINYGRASIICESTVYEGINRFDGWLANHEEGQHILVGCEDNLKPVKRIGKEDIN